MVIKKVELALLLFSLLVIGLFLMGCAPQSAEDKLAVGDLTPEEKAQLPSDMKEGGTALAGKAVDFSGCIDADSTSIYDKNSLLTKSTTTYAGGSKEDKCYTWNKGTPQEKTRLIEGTCKNKKFLYWYATCKDYLGKDYICKEGKCEQEVSDFVLEEVPLDWDITKPILVKEIKGIFAEETDLDGNKVSLQNLKLQLFMDVELRFFAKIEWETSVPAEFSGLATNSQIISKLNNQPMDLEYSYTSIPKSVSKIEIQPAIYLEEDTKYVFKVQSFFNNYFPEKGQFIEYNLSFKTPLLSKMNLECEKIFYSGLSSNKIDIIFIPIHYSDEEINSNIPAVNVQNILFGKNPDSQYAMERISFFDVPIINKSSTAFNILLIKVNNKINFSNKNQLLAAAKSCGFNKKEDFIVSLNNLKVGMGYAEGAGIGQIIHLFKSTNFQGTGTLFAHELAHLIGMDEEYYMDSGTTEPRNSPNCDYGNLTCSKWCKNTNLEKTKLVYAANDKYNTCIKIIIDKNESAWKDFCPTLDLTEIIQNNVADGSSYAGAKSQDEYCTFPLQKVIGYTCYAGTFWSLDRDESLDLGLDCQEGYHCYYGCGTHYEWTRSDFVNIMGGGAMGETQYLYKQKEKNAGEKILPDFSPAANQALKQYFDKYD